MLYSARRIANVMIAIQKTSDKEYE
jgi:hypothetical protein